MYSEYMKRVDVEIEKNLASSPPGFKRIINDSYLMKGKKIRPMITILSYLTANGHNEPSERIYTMAAGIELIHIASLIHDDINDNGKFRRGSPTLNSIYGNNVAQVVGDILFAKAFGLCSLFNNDVVQMITQACINLGEGELLQHQIIDNIEVSKDTIFEVIDLKTASLFSAAAYCGACFADVSEEKKKMFYNFGKHIGIAFQILDDIDDYTSNLRDTGKENIHDFEEGKITLPIYFLLNNLSKKEKLETYEKLKSLSRKNKESLKQYFLEEKQAINKSFNEVEKYCELANKDLEKFRNKELAILLNYIQNKNDLIKNKILRS